MPFNYDNYAKRFEENPAIFFLSIFVCFLVCYWEIRRFELDFFYTRVGMEKVRTNQV